MALLNFIKGLFNILSLLIFLMAFVAIAAKFQKKKLAKSLLIFAVIVFLLSSTSYLPHYLAKKLESQYQPLYTGALNHQTEKIYIHLLGSGYGLDRRLPATAQLCTTAQIRLLEAMRIYHQLPNSVLVCSANGLKGFETQAAVAKKAAILLGADSSRVITLDSPSTTKEEAAALAERLGIAATIIVVTDALHMPRAYQFFSQQGFHPIAAPCNYKAMDAENDTSTGWWPAFSNINLSDAVIHEYIGFLKAHL